MPRVSGPEQTQSLTLVKSVRAEICVASRNLSETPEEQGMGKETFFQVYAKEKTRRQPLSSYFFVLIIFFYFSDAFSNTKSNFFPGQLPVNRESQ